MYIIYSNFLIPYAYGSFFWFHILAKMLTSQLYSNKKLKIITKQVVVFPRTVLSICAQLFCDLIPAHLAFAEDWQSPNVRMSVYWQYILTQKCSFSYAECTCLKFFCYKGAPMIMVDIQGDNFICYQSTDKKK